MFPEFEHEGVSQRFTRKYVKLCSQSVSHDKQTKLLFSMRKVILAILVFDNVFRQKSRVQLLYSVQASLGTGAAEASNYSSTVPPRARTGRGAGVINPIREPGPAVISPEQSGPKSPQPQGRHQRGVLIRLPFSHDNNRTGDQISFYIYLLPALVVWIK